MTEPEMRMKGALRSPDGFWTYLGSLLQCKITLILNDPTPVSEYCPITISIPVTHVDGCARIATTALPEGSP